MWIVSAEAPQYLFVANERLVDDVKSVTTFKEGRVFIGCHVTRIRIGEHVAFCIEYPFTGRDYRSVRIVVRLLKIIEGVFDGLDFYARQARIDRKSTRLNSSHT